MSTSDLFRYVRLRTDVTTEEPSHSVTHMELASEAQHDHGVREVITASDDEQTEWANQYRVSDQFITSWSQMTYPWRDHFKRLPYPRLPDRNLLIQPVPDGLLDDTRYQTDRRRLLRSALTMKILNMPPPPRQLLEYAYQVLTLMPQLTTIEQAPRVLFSYGLRRTLIAKPDTEPTTPDTTLASLQEDRRKLDELKLALLDLERSRERDVINAARQHGQERTELVSKLRDGWRRTPRTGNQDNAESASTGMRSRGNTLSEQRLAMARRELSSEFRESKTSLKISRERLRAKQSVVGNLEFDTSAGELAQRFGFAQTKHSFTAVNEIDKHLRRIDKALRDYEDKQCCSGFPHIQGHIDSIRLLGEGELVVVRERLLKYEVSDISHIENVLPGETRSRTHTSKRTTEEFYQTVSEEETSTTSELETTTQAEFQQEIQTELRARLASDVGASGSGSYGPVANFEANASLSAGVDTGLTTSQSDKFSREVVQKAVEQVRSKVVTTSSRRRLVEIEDVNVHAFNNASADIVNGVYCYLNRVSCAQAYLYGRRVMLMAYIAKPGKDIICVTQHGSAKRLLDNTDAPPPFDVVMEDLDEDSFRHHAALYKVHDIEPPPDEFMFIEKAFKSDQTSAQQRELALKSVVEFLFPFFKEYKKWAITDSLDIPDGYEVDTVTVTVNHGNNGMSLPSGFLAAPLAAPAALNSAGIPLALAALTMPATMYSMESSSVIVNIGNQAQRSSYFFFEFSEILDTLLDLASDTFAHLSAMDDNLAQLREDLSGFVDLHFDDFFKEDMPEDAAEIVEGQLNLLKSNLTDFINAVPSLFMAVPSIKFSGLFRIPSIDFDWESMTDELTDKRNEIAGKLMSLTELTDEFKALLQSLNNTLINPFLAIFQNAINNMLGDYASTFTDPLQEFASVFDSSENLYFDHVAPTKATALKNSLPISLVILAANAGVTLNVVVRARRTDRAIQQWQIDSYHKLYQGYLQLKQDYEAQLYNANIGSTPRANPALLRQMENDELKKFTIRALDRMHSQAATIPAAKLSFFEHAIEWSNLSAKITDYGVSCEDYELGATGLLAYADDIHAKFLKAEAAYVLLPVRPEYTLSVLSYLKTGDWSDPELSDEETIALYQRILHESVLAEKPKPLGDPIPIVQPTTLIKAVASEPVFGNSCADFQWN